MLRASFILSVLVAACGGGSPPAMPDAGPEPGTVEIETYSVCCTRDPYQPPGVPVSGIEIIVHDVDGSVEVISTEDGRATIEVHAGAAVTALYRTDAELAFADARLYTFLEVEPGDVLRFGETWRPDLLPGPAMTVDFPEVSGAQMYEVHGACTYDSVQAPESAGVVGNSSACPPGDQDIYLFALDDTFETTHFGVLEDVAFVEGGSVALAAWEPVGQLTVGVSGVSTAVTEILATAESYGNGQAALQWQSMNIVDIEPDGSFTWVTPWAPVGDMVRVGASFSTGTGVQSVHQRIAREVTSVTIAEPITLPWVTAQSADLGAGTLSFTLDGDAPYDASIAYLGYGGGDVVSSAWMVFAPPGRSGENVIELPELPPELAELDPRDASEGAGGVTIVDLEDAADYRGYRQMPVWELMSAAIRVSSLRND